MKIKKFIDFLNENHTDWKDMTFNTIPEKEVADVTEETLNSKYLMVFTNESDEYKKLKQHESTQAGEKILETTGNDLILFTSPLEFIRWDKKTDDSSYILKAEDYSKI